MALLVGRLFGKNNFSYFISPKKTWEGFTAQILSLFLAIMVARFFAWLLGLSDAGLTNTNMFVIGFFMVVASILGDLMESIIKRSCSVKDSGTVKVIGQMGGILDKFDSFGVVWTTTFFCLRFLVPEELPY